MQPFDWLLENYYYFIAIVVGIILLIVFFVIFIVKSGKKDEKGKEETVKKVGEVGTPGIIYEQLLPDKPKVREEIYTQLPPEGTPGIIYEKLPDVVLAEKDYYAKKIPAKLGVETSQEKMPINPKLANAKERIFQQIPLPSIK